MGERHSRPARRVEIPGRRFAWSLTDGVTNTQMSVYVSNTNQRFISETMSDIVTDAGNSLRVFQSWLGKSACASLSFVVRQGRDSLPGLVIGPPFPDKLFDRATSWSPASRTVRALVSEDLRGAQSRRDHSWLAVHQAPKLPQLSRRLAESSRGRRPWRPREAAPMTYTARLPNEPQGRSRRRAPSCGNSTHAHLRNRHKAQH